MRPIPRVPRREAGTRHTLEWFLAASLLLVGVAALGTHVVAQVDPGEWAEPINLSHGGGASTPALVVVPGATLRVLWWDQFEGLMVAGGPISFTLAIEVAAIEPEADRTSWSEPAPAPIQFSRTVPRGEQESTLLSPIQIMPRIMGDAEGRAHAFWRGEVDEETGDQPLQYSRLAPDKISWSRPVTVAIPIAAFDVAADLSGTLHLVYVQPADTNQSPTGLYHRLSRDGGTKWSAPTAIQQSRYLRLLPSEDDVLRLTAHDANHLSVAWHDTHQDQVVIAQSLDGGETWQQPRPFGPADQAPLHGRLVAAPGQPERVLWPLAHEVGSALAVSSSGDALTVALWDGTRWASTRHLDIGLQNPDLGQALHLEGLRFAFVADRHQEMDGATLAVVGTDEQGDLWLTGTSVETLTRLMAWRTDAAPESEAEDEPGPVNLSQSGAASNPALTAGPDGRLHAFWWDEFDGLTIADGYISASAVTSGTEEIVVLRDTWSEPRPVPLAAGTTPRIISDATGRIYAFWLGIAEQPEGGDEEARPLLYSQISIDGVAWSSPTVLADSALVYDVMPDLSGGLHLAYLHSQQTATDPAGVYYRHTGDDGTGWSAPALVHASRYLRLMLPESAHLRVAADEAGGVYLTWDDPRLARSLLAYSSDAGSSWQTPTEVGDEEAGSRQGRLAAPPGGEVLVLWQTHQSTGMCELHQAPASAVLDGSAGDGQRVLENLSNCPMDERFIPAGEGQMLMIDGTGSEAMTVALWDGERWSEPARWGKSFEDAELGRMVYLGDLHAALVQVPDPSAGGATAGALVALGTDGEGDVWVTSSQVGDLDMIFATPSPWSVPVSVSQEDTFPGIPAAAADAEGALHVMWSEATGANEPGTTLFYARWDGTQWTRPAAVLSSGDGKADEPALVAVGDRLHAVWSGGQRGIVLYSHAFAHDAYTSSGWSEAAPLPTLGEVGSWPDIAAGPDGRLHVVYAVPLNEGRGIYYTGSRDGGETWSQGRQLFDAAGEGWLIADHPHVAVDAQGLLHVTWVRGGMPGSGQSEGVYYASSYDGGGTWTEAFEIAAGAHAWPVICSGGGGRVHIVWTETNGQSGWWHRWSANGGQTWSRQERVPGFEDVSAPVSLLENGNGALHLVGVGADVDGRPALLLSTWDGQRWGSPEAYSLDLKDVEPGVAARIEPIEGRLQVLFRAASESEGDGVLRGIWHTGRQLPEVAVTLPAAAAPILTVTPAPTAAATLTPRPTANFGTAPLAALGDSALPIPVPALAAGGLAVVVVAAGIGGRWLLTRRR